MNASFGRLLTVPVAALVLASFALTPVAQAAGGREGGGGRAAAHGGGGGGGGGGARAGGGAAGGGGANRQAAQANQNRPDARANEVRSSSANNVNSSNRNTNANRNTNVNSNQNVNVNRNVNVNASGNNNCCGGGWDNDYHPIAGAVAVGAAVAVTSAVIGSMVQTVPSNCVPVNYSGMVYQQCGTTWYQPQGSQFVVVNAPY